jgi:hypothetical protein
VIVVAYFDRLFRSIEVQAEFAKRVEAAGGELFAADVGEVRPDTGSGWITSSMLGVVAEFCDRVLVMRDGVVRRELSGGDLNKSALVSASVGAASSSPGSPSPGGAA